MPDEPFHVWLSEQVREAGYDIDGKRSGGKAKLAEESGVSRGQVGRALAGDSIPDIDSQRRLAHAIADRLHTDGNELFREMLIRSGVMHADDFPAEEEGVQRRRLGPDDVADAWGITDSQGRAMVRAMFEVLVRPDAE